MKKVVTIVMMLLMLALPFAMAAPTGGNATFISSERGTESTSTTQTIEGGNVTLINVSGSSITSNWGGFFGNVSGGLQLTDASANTFYEWTISDVTGAVVYATNDTTTFGALVAGTNGVQPSYINGTNSDNWSNTFAANEAFTSASFNVASTPYVDTQSGTGTFRTYSLYDTADAALVYAAKADAGETGFNGDSLDFQMLVPASGVTTYNFYLELP